MQEQEKGREGERERERQTERERETKNGGLKKMEEEKDELRSHGLKLPHFVGGH